MRECEIVPSSLYVIIEKILYVNLFHKSNNIANISDYKFQLIIDTGV